MAAEIQKHVEVQSKALPPATLDTLQQMRREQCSGGNDFRLSSFQLFLRRILSPDSPVRNMLLVHGTGSGKTCSAIQVAEEYILRPEFQDKKVMVVSSGTVQDNFRTQLFDVQRVKQDASGLLKSPQCTGRRYLEMLERAQSENMRWENPENRERLGKIVQRMVDEFYDFTGYIEFSNMIERQSLSLSANDFAAWVRKTFNGKLLIVDEAHNLREGNSDEGFKLVSAALQKVVKIAEGMTLVLLTATPMYDNFGEIMFLLNLFLWNDKRQATDAKVITSSIFNANGTFVSPESEARFRGYCHDYISFIRGENPFTFPFRLPPPREMVAPLDRKTAFKGKTKKIMEPRKYLPLAMSFVKSPQKERVAAVSGTNVQDDMIPTIVVSPDGRPVTKCFDKSTDATRAQFRYAAGVESFLSPSNVANHAAKYATILKCIEESVGIVFVYSNYIRGGALQFAMSLEEHGYEPALGVKLLENPSGEYKGGAPMGKYAFLTSDMTERQLQTIIRRLRNPLNANGQDIRVVIASPLVSEGIDLKNIRQIHILDPWYNMSRMEQIIGRGLRNCSHTNLPFEEQNCTVYLHITRYEDSTTETYDEYVYRVFVESKAKSIAMVKRVLEESAVDCMTQLSTNQLPDDWRALVIPQKRAQKGEKVEMRLSEMSAPSFSDAAASLVCWAGAATSADDTYVRPLSSYFDIRDEVFDSLMKLFEKKPIWSQDDLLETLHYAPEVVSYILDNAIRSHLKLKDASGRIGLLENREGLYAFSPNESGDGATMLERSIPANAYSTRRRTISAEEEMPPLEPAIAEVEVVPAPKAKVSVELPKYTFPFDASRFPEEVRRSFIIEQVMSQDDRAKLILSGATPEFEQVVEGTEYIVLGEGEVYDRRTREPVELVGGDLDVYKTWVSKKMDQLLVEIADNDKILCTVEWDGKKKGVLKIASFTLEGGEVKRTETSKTIIPKACSFYKTDQLDAFVKLFTDDIPKGTGNKDSQCVFLSLLARMGSEKTFWTPPEIWSIMSENSENAKALRTRIKEKQIARKK